MQQTLFIVPQDWFPTWILGFWLVFGAIYLAISYRTERFAAVAREFIPVYMIVAAVLYFVMPRLSVPIVNPDDPAGPFINGGLAIRGYGVFLMFAILGGISLVALRAPQAGISLEKTLTLCFVMIVSGLVGARVFFVIQYWNEFASGSLWGILDMTKGGLVVYGSLIGGLIGAMIYFFRSGLPIARTMDVLAPAMILGLAIGRIGCLMNGCCFGGVCGTEFPLGLTFPAGSPPYFQQLENGELLGLELIPTTDSEAKKRFPFTVKSIGKSSPLFSYGIQAGDLIMIAPPEPQRLQVLKNQQLDFPLDFTVVVQRLGATSVSAKLLPERSLAIHPTQIYAAVNAFLLCGALFFLYPIRQFDGQVFSVLMIAYPISRFVLEIIRTDEGGQFGTTLSISQWVSAFTVLAGFIVYAIFMSRRQRSVQPSVAKPEA
ncbi:MAG: prolipoprotein diacylglyceryl transferase [Pirellulaceae bacterium]